MASGVSGGGPWRSILALALLIAIVGGLWFAYHEHEDTHEKSAPEDSPSGPSLTQIVTAKLEASQILLVGRLRGTVQAEAKDIRWGGMLQSTLIVKMPYSVAYHVDLSKVKERDLQWDEQNRTLIVDAPDVTVDTPNIDETRARVVDRSGVFVTRQAGEQLSRGVSVAATEKAASEAASPQRMAQAREHARSAVIATMRAPLAATGNGDARIVVTFPAERDGRDGQRWDQSRTPDQVLKGQVPAKVQ